MNKILFIEDDEGLSYGLKYALEKENYDVTHCCCINECEKALEESQFDLLLLDVMLPDGNGLDYCRKLRSTSDIPVIFLTACDEETNIMMGLDIGGDDYITKPFKVGELLSRIKAVLRRSCSGTDDSRFSFSKQYDLTFIETKLLTLLRNNKGQIVERNQILDLLWDNKGEFVDDNTLSVHISRLREKIGSSHIITVRGVGYRWAD